MLIYDMKRRNGIGIGREQFLNILTRSVSPRSFEYIEFHFVIFVNIHTFLSFSNGLFHLNL